MERSTELLHVVERHLQGTHLILPCYLFTWCMNCCGLIWGCSPIKSVQDKLCSKNKSRILELKPPRPTVGSSDLPSAQDLLQDLWHPSVLADPRHSSWPPDKLWLKDWIACLGARGLEPGPLEKAPLSWQGVNQGAAPTHCCKGEIRRPAGR